VKKTFDQLNRSTLDLFTASPSLLPAPPDWPAKTRVCGFLNPVHVPSAFTPPDGLEAFFAAGPPPVFIGFGSMAIAEQDGAGLFRLVREAVDLAGVRALVQLKGGASDGPVFAIGAAPHDALFPRCAAIVHHGGTGTTQSAMRAGKPSVVVAHITDQFLWGKVLSARGVGPTALTRRALTARKLAAAITAAVSTPAYATAAAALGEKLRAEDGVATAVKLITEAGPR
jgi:UDP:flavonoid glycosyltransferase YjiC (YdhE family)